jgi:uncharacterized OsmC-like protein
MRDVAAAIERAEAAFRARPNEALHDDSLVHARWVRGTRIVATHANGTEVATDMPDVLGGSGDHVTPGWLFRAGVAACFSTTVAMTAAANGIELTTLEVTVRSRSDSRGLLGVTDADGSLVPGFVDVCLEIRVAATDVSADRLRALIETAAQRSPMLSALRSATPVRLRVELA